MPFGPSQNETPLLLQVPFAISLVLALCLLVGRFSALVGAVIAFVLYIGVAISALGSIVGAMMLAFSGWAAVVFLTVALFLSTRESHAQSIAPRRGERRWC